MMMTKERLEQIRVLNKDYEECPPINIVHAHSVEQIAELLAYIDFLEVPSVSRVSN